MKKSKRPGLVPALIVAAACFLSFFWQLGSYGLFDLDEGLYVEAAREMNLSRDYVTPRVNRTKFLEKPPLIYWLSAGSQLLLGKSEFAARLPAAAASAGLAFLVFLIAGRVLGVGAGLLAGVSYALSPLVFGAGRQLTMDAVLSFWIAAALFAFFRGWLDEKRASRWLMAFWACCGFGTLAKGAPGILIPLATVAIFLVVSEGFRAGIHRLVTGTRVLLGVPLFLLIVVPWHVAAWQANGSPFVDEYIVRQHLGRFRGGDTAHRAPFWFYAPGFLLGFFPWSFFTIPALFERAESGKRSPADSARLLCRIWFGLVFLLFSASGSKLISYVLPLYAPAAILGADWAVRAAARKESRTGYLWALGLAALLAGVFFLAALMHNEIIAQVESATGRAVERDQITPAMVRFVIALTGTAAAACLCGWLAALFKRGPASYHVMGAGMGAFLAVAVIMGLPAVDSAYLRPMQSLAKAGGRLAVRDRARLVIITSARRPGALFYVPDALIREPAGVVEITDTEQFESKLPASPFYLLSPADLSKRIRGATSLRSLGGWNLSFVPP